MVDKNPFINKTGRTKPVYRKGEIVDKRIIDRNPFLDPNDVGTLARKVQALENTDAEPVPEKEAVTPTPPAYPVGGMFMQVATMMEPAAENATGAVFLNSLSELSSGPNKVVPPQELLTDDLVLCAVYYANHASCIIVALLERAEEPPPDDPTADNYLFDTWTPSAGPPDRWNPRWMYAAAGPVPGLNVGEDPVYVMPGFTSGSFPYITATGTPSADLKETVVLPELEYAPTVVVTGAVYAAPSALNNENGTGIRKFDGTNWPVISGTETFGDSPSDTSSKGASIVYDHTTGMYWAVELSSGNHFGSTDYVPTRAHMKTLYSPDGITWSEGPHVPWVSALTSHKELINFKAENGYLVAQVRERRWYQNDIAYATFVRSALDTSSEWTATPLNAAENVATHVLGGPKCALALDTDGRLYYFQPGSGGTLKVYGGADYSTVETFDTTELMTPYSANDSMLCVAPGQLLITTGPSVFEVVGLVLVHLLESPSLIVEQAWLHEYPTSGAVSGLNRVYGVENGYSWYHNQGETLYSGVLIPDTE